MARAVESVVWWTVLVGVWLTTLSTVNWQDLLVAAVVAVPCALAATMLRGVYHGCWRPASAWTLPLAVVRGCAALFSRHTQLRHIPARPAARKAIKTVIVSASPGTVVLDDKGDSLLVHGLGDE
jgi:multisubunit Na+/H+ antiporter MnhE subunit